MPLRPPRSAPAPWPGAAAGLAALFVGIGLARFGYSPLIPALVRERWFAAAPADFLGAINLVGYVVGAWIAGQWLARQPPGPWVRAAMLVAAGSFLMCARPWGFAWFFAWRLLAGIAAGLLMVLAVPTVLARTPPARRGLVGGIIFTGVGAGTVVAGAVVPRLVRLGLTTTWLYLGALGIVLTGAAWPYWRRHGLPPAASAAPAVSSAPPRPRFRSAMTLLLAAYCANAIGFAPHSLFWVDYIARELRRGLAAGGADFMWLGVAATVGPTLAGLLGDRFGIRRCLAWGLAIEAGALALPVFGSAAAALALSSVAVGATAMGVTTLASARVIELVPADAQKQVWGWMTMAFAIAYASAGAGFSLLFAHTGAYRGVFAVAALVLLAGSLLAALAG